MSANTKPGYSHHHGPSPAKPAFARGSWFLAHFFSAMLLRRTLSTPSSASREENAPETQVRTSWRRHDDGFTLPELVISISLIGIISVSLLAVMTDYFVSITRNNLLIDMTVDSQNLLRTAVEELRYGAGVRSSNAIADANEPGGGWTTSNANFVIIIAVPAIDSDGDYIINTDTGSPYNNELVYFKQGTTLYKRTLAHPSATGNSMTTTCPQASSSPSCPADIRLHEHVNDMIFTLYDQDNASTTDPLLARSVKIDLSLEQDTFGDPLVLDNSVRVTLRNTF